MMKMDYEEFEEKYFNPDSEVKILDVMDFKEAGANLAPVKRIWTMVSADYGEVYIVPGILYVNRMGYIISDKPWEHSDIEVDYNNLITTGYALHTCAEFIENTFGKELTEEQMEELEELLNNR